jgi:DNA-binding SARP family transcriptional activator
MPMAARKSLRNGRKIRTARFLGPNRLKVDGPSDVWLTTPRRAYDEHLTDTLTSVLEEWIARNPGRLVDDKTLTAILPEALDEFIWRHLDDFG